MADDENSEVVNMEGEEEEDITSLGSAAAVQPSATSVVPEEQPEPEPSIKEPSVTSVEPAASKSVQQVEKTEPSTTSIEFKNSNITIIVQNNEPAAAESEEPPALEAPSGILKNTTSELGQGAELLAAEDIKPEAEPEPPRYVEPLGQATEESLLDRDMAPWILDKLYHEGKMGRFNMAEGSGKAKMEDGGLSTYEDYTWRLEKLYRQVPEDMALGKVRLKPDELMYEEENWVLGKMFRDIHEQDYGYQPSAEHRESNVDLCDAIEVSQFPPEPPPCLRPPASVTSLSRVDGGNYDCNCPPIQAPSGPCSTKVMSPSTGKVFEFSYTGIMAVSVDSPASAPQPSGNGILKDPCTSPLITPCTAGSMLTNVGSTQELLKKSTPSKMNADLSCGGSGPAGGSVRTIPSSVPCGQVQKTAAAPTPNDRACRNKMRCESRIQAVCDTARKAMAIYDTMTGCDNFPCNEGDKPEKEFENIEDGVWPWLYQLIFKMLPVDSNQNPLVTIPEESSYNDNVDNIGNDEQQLQSSEQSSCNE